MTRQEALDKMYAILSHSKDCQNVDATKVAFLLKDIFDYFEKQCERCKFFGNDNGESWVEGYEQYLKERVCKNCFYYAEGVCCCDKSPLITEIVDENFGCINFKRKIK